MPSDPPQQYMQFGLEIRKHGKERILGGYQRIVFTNGCFDILHPGHVKVIEKCRELAGPYGAVVVGVNEDVSVRKLKGPSRPVNTVEIRARMVAALRGVDHVVTFDEDTPLEIIQGIRPDVIVKGGDYKVKDVVGNKFATVVIVPTEPGFSTTDIIRRSHG